MNTAPEYEKVLQGLGERTWRETHHDITDKENASQNALRIARIERVKKRTDIRTLGKTHVRKQD